jgi:Fe-S cluster assembly iron-binding protein IscA
LKVGARREKRDPSAEIICTVFSVPRTAVFCEIGRARSPGAFAHRTIGPVVSIVRKAGGGIKSIFSRAPSDPTAAREASSSQPAPAAADRAREKPSEAFRTSQHARPEGARPGSSAHAPPPVPVGASVETRLDDRPATAAMASVKNSNADDGKKASESSTMPSQGGGYHYFHDQANRGTAPAAKPVRLSEAEAAALSAKLEGSGGKGLSSWNTAGTWEERTHTKWAEKRIGELLVTGDAIAETDAARVLLTSVKKLEGDATVVMVRGKPRHGFDFSLTLTFECVFKEKKDGNTDDDDGTDEAFTTIKGTVKVPEASRDVLEDENVDFVCDVDEKKPARRSKEALAVSLLKKSLEPVLLRAFGVLDAELKLRAES